MRTLRFSSLALALAGFVLIGALSPGIPFADEIGGPRLDALPPYVVRGVVETKSHPGPHNRGVGWEMTGRFECYYFGDRSVSIFRHENGSEAFSEIVGEGWDFKYDYYIGGSGRRLNEDASPDVGLFLVNCSPHFMESAVRRRLIQDDPSIIARPADGEGVLLIEDLDSPMPECEQENSWLYIDDALTSFAMSMLFPDNFELVVYQNLYSDHDESFYRLPRRAEFTLFDITKPPPRSINLEADAKVESMEETSETFETVLASLKAEGFILLKKEGEMASSMERRVSRDNQPQRYVFIVAIAALAIASFIVALKITRRK